MYTVVWVSKGLYSSIDIVKRCLRFCKNASSPDRTGFKSGQDFHLQTLIPITVFQTHLLSSISSSLDHHPSSSQVLDPRFHPFLPNHFCPQTNLKLFISLHPSITLRLIMKFGKTYDQTIRSGPSHWSQSAIGYKSVSHPQLSDHPIISPYSSSPSSWLSIH